MAEGFLMEACVDSVESAVNAERGGWLCEHLSAPFIKPPMTYLVKVKTKTGGSSVKNRGTRLNTSTHHFNTFSQRPFVC